MRLLPALILALGLTTGVAAAQQPERLRGEITASEPGKLAMTTADGKALSLSTAPNMPVAAVASADLADIRAGDFVGVGARRDADGSLKAVQVVIFPDAMRGTGEGHRAWGVMPEATMTNATVASKITDIDGPTITLKYKGGQQQVAIPQDANIIALQPAQATDLAAGQQAIIAVSRQPDGSLLATRVTFARPGAKLPL